MTIHGAMWLVTVASIIGTVANIYQRRWCFWVWLITNLAWATFDAWIGAYAQATLQAVYAGLAVWGLIQWARKAQEAAQGAPDGGEALSRQPARPMATREAAEGVAQAWESGEDHQ